MAEARYHAKILPFHEQFEAAVNMLKLHGNYREFSEFERLAGRFPYAYDHQRGREIIIWCNNDYLGMGQHPVVLNAMQDAVRRMGAGAGGTRNIAGTNHPLVRLEHALAQVHGTEAALVMSSGYTTNATVLATLAKGLPDCIIFSDEQNHASMIEGIKQGRAQKYIFQHNNVKHLRMLLEKAPANAPKIIAFESLYSMDGDMAPIAEICDVAEEFGALTYLDEVHAVGLYGATGGGLAQAQAQAPRISLIQGTLGKAYGLMGGYIAGNASVIDYVRSFAPGLIFTTALPPAVAAGAMASVRHLQSSNAEREAHQHAVAYTRAALEAAGIAIMPAAQAHILPVIVEGAERCRAVSNALMEQYGLFVQHINAPTVPEGRERLRITPTPQHTEEMAQQLAAALKEMLNRA